MLCSRIESINNEMDAIKEEDDFTSKALAAAEKEVNELRKSIAMKEGELSSLKDSKVQEDQAVLDVEQKRQLVEAEIQQLRGLEKEEGEKYRITLDQKAKAHAERCKPLEVNRTAILKRIEEIEDALKKADVKVKTQRAKNGSGKNEKSKRSNLNAKKASVDLAKVESQTLEVERKIEDQNHKNSVLEKEVERLNYVNQTNDDKSDDEEIKPRKFSVSSSAKAKRKLTDSKPDLDVFNVDICSGGDSPASQFNLPSTPVNKSRLLPSILSSSNNSVKKKSTLASMIESDKTSSGRSRRSGNVVELPTPTKKPLLDQSQSHRKEDGIRRNQTSQEKENSAGLDFFELTSQSQ